MTGNFLFAFLSHYTINKARLKIVNVRVGGHIELYVRFGLPCYINLFITFLLTSKI